MTAAMRREWLTDIGQLNQWKLDQSADPEIETRISQYEMAFKMQSSVPELADLSTESKETLDLYGPQVQETGYLRSQLSLSATIGRARGSVRSSYACRLGSTQ